MKPLIVEFAIWSDEIQIPKVPSYHNLITGLGFASAVADAFASLCFNYHTATDPGTPYNVTVSASTAVGKVELVSIVVFAEQQGRRCFIRNIYWTTGI